MTVRDRVWLAPILAALWFFSGTGGCQGDGNPEVSRKTGGSGGLGGSGGKEGGGNAGGQDGGEPDGADAVSPDAPLAPLRLGILPVPASVDGGTSALDEKQAVLETLSVGSRAVSLAQRWNGLFAKPLEPVPQAWQKLGDIALLFRESGSSLLFCLSLVDRTLDARPVGSAPGWNDLTTRAALEAAVDRVFETFGTELAALSFGNEIDRYLAKVGAKERQELFALLSHGIDYARAHPSRPPAAVVGVTVGSAALSSPSKEIAGLVAASDVAIVTYYPLDSSWQARPPTLVPDDLDALDETLSVDAGDGGDAAPPKPIFVQEIGYPSAADNASSTDQQNAFFQQLFQALATRRGRFPFLAINGLHDAPPGACQNEATALGAPASAPAIAARCSLGLRSADGTAKPAYATVLSGLAAFSKP